MTKDEAKRIIESAFSSEFNESKFQNFIANLLKRYTPVDKIREGQFIKESFKTFVLKYKIIGYFEDAEKNKIDILEVTLNKDTSLERARTAQRNFVAEYLKTHGRDAALVAFISPENKDWRLSLVKLEHSLEVSGEKLKTKEEITPAKRWSFLVGASEGSHTAQSRFVDLLVSDMNPNLAELETAFDIEKVTDEFFEKYKELYFQFKENLDLLLEKDALLKKDFDDKVISSVDFSKKTLGQIVFLYFLQKKGWFGVSPDKKWGEGRKKFLRELFDRRGGYGKNFFNDILEPLFYEALAQDRGIEAIYPRLNNCRMPFLNGGLFEPMNGYKWETTDIVIPDELFSNTNKTKEGDIGDGILDIFDRYNFTVNENEPLEKEVAVDPEMLGKVFENLLDIKDRKSKGAFYTPREIVHYMCQESLINYLETETKNEIPKEDLEIFIRKGDRIIENDRVALQKIQEKEAKGYEYKGTYELLLPNSIRTKAEVLDNLLKNIKVADPAVGSGAFPLGMITEIVRARKVLNIYLNENTSDYDLKLHTISHSIHGVDIDPGSVEIAKLRLWLALVVDEDTPHPLPNLDHKIMQGNCLISEYEGIMLFDESIFQKEKKGTEQASLGFGKSSSELKMEVLQHKTADFVHESQRSKKQQLKEEIDNLKWELIEETLKEQGKIDKLAEIIELRRKNICPFFIWKLEFSDVFMEKGGFDVIIGNPPYVGEKGNKEIFQHIANSSLGNRFYQGKMDLFYFFFHLALDYLHDGGVMAFITTNYFITATGAKKLRWDIQDRGSVLKLLNFGELKIFESALGQHNMITMLVKGKKDIKAETLVTRRHGYFGPTMVEEVIKGRDKDTDYYELNQDEIYTTNGNIKLTIGGLDRVLDKVKNSTVLLDICDISNGIHTQADHLTDKKFSARNDKTKIVGDGIYVLNSDNQRDAEIIESLNDEEKAFLKPFYKNSDIGKYYSSEKTNKNVIYLDKQKHDINKLHGIKKHLLNFEQIILQASSNAPYLHRPKKIVFDGEKIIVPQRSKRNTFGYNNIPWYASADVYFITNPKDGYTLKYLLGILNSRMIYVWLYNRGKRKGDMLELYQEPLSRIPIPVITEENKVQMQEVESLVTQILALKKTDPKSDTSALETEIDRLVYQLYGLTEEEIAIVENSSKK